MSVGSRLGLFGPFGTASLFDPDSGIREANSFPALLAEAQRKRQRFGHMPTAMLDQFAPLPQPNQLVIDAVAGAFRPNLRNFDFDAANQSMGFTPAPTPPPFQLGPALSFNDPRELPGFDPLAHLRGTDAMTPTADLIARDSLTSFGPGLPHRIGGGRAGNQVGAQLGGSGLGGGGVNF